MQKNLPIKNDEKLVSLAKISVMKYIAIVILQT